MIKRIALGAAAALGLFVLFILVRTLTYGGGAQASAWDLPEAPFVSAENAAEHLAEAIRIRTITVAPGDPRPGQDGPWRELHDWLETTYPRAHRAMEKELVAGYTLLYAWEGSDPSLKPILLMAHQDVVPVNIGTEGDWTGGPFDGEIIDGYVYGRGAIDDKGSMVALMEAAEALARTGFEPRRTIYFMFGHDEEVSGSGAAAGVQVLKDRGVEPEMALDEGFMVIDPNPLTGAALGLVGVAEKGYVTFEITAIGAGGHSSTPPRDSATVQLSRALIALDENQMPADFDGPLVAGMFEAAGPDMPFLQRMAFANLWLFRGAIENTAAKTPALNAMIRTTTAPTMLVGSAKENVLAQRATAIVNFRIHPADTEDDILAHINSVLEDVPGEFEVKMGRQGIRGEGASPVSPTDNRAYRVIAAAASEAGNGAAVAPGLVLGATDGRYAYAITDNVYRFAPAVMSTEDLTGFHGTNERLSVANMKRMAEGYAQIILGLDAPDEAAAD
ncbi:MAG: M20 family peptidase [Pseudomonadota bacterium]